MLLLAATALAAPPDLLPAGVALGAKVPAVTAALAAATPAVHEPAQPGALSAGLLDRPGLLALLHRARVDEALLDGLPAKGPTVVTAAAGDAHAAYAFLDGRLVAIGLTLPADAVAPAADPFRPDRLQPLRDTLDRLCKGLRPSARDRYGNATAYVGAGCHGGRMTVFLEPTRPDAAVQVVVAP